MTRGAEVLVDLGAQLALERQPLRARRLLEQAAVESVDAAEFLDRPLVILDAEVDDDLRAELADRLVSLGYDGDFDHALNAWAGTENLEERVDGVEQLDPVVLAELRGS